MTRISVVVAVRNGARTLQVCLDSVTHQSHPDVELVVIDGASTDRTREVIRANSPSIAYWCSEPDRGIYEAWNKALSRITGDWVCFLGADDVFASTDALAHLLAVAGGADLVTAKVAIVDARGAVLRVVGRPWDWRGMRAHQVVAHPGALHRREVFSRVGSFDATLHVVGDYDFLLRLGPTANATFLDEVIVLMSKGGVSRRSLFPVLRESWRVQARHAAIGPVRASYNFAIAYAKGLARIALGRE